MWKMAIRLKMDLDIADIAMVAAHRDPPSYALVISMFDPLRHSPLG